MSFGLAFVTDISTDQRSARRMRTDRRAYIIIDRQLAPTFKLDPNGFVGYLWLSAAKLKEAIYRPNALLNRIRGHGVSDLSEIDQLTLFD